MRRLGILGASLVIALTLSLAPAVSAEASTRVLCVGYDACAKKGYTDHGYKERRDNLFWRMAGDHNCTNYVAYLFVKKGMPNVRPWVGDGNAYAWGDFTTEYRDSTPVVGAVAWWDANRAPASSTGHVSYVEKVISKNEIIVSEDNWKGEFRWKRITKTGGGWPSSFIHFKDSRTPALPALSATQVSQSVWTDSTKTTAVVSSAMRPGTTAWVELTYRNAGATTWRGVTLTTQQPVARESALATGWKTPSIAATQSPAVVTSGSIATFGFAVTIPEGATAGTSWTEHFAPTTKKGVVMNQSDAWVHFEADDRLDFETRPLPTISGSVREAQTVTAVAGQWPDGTALAYSWKRNGAVIPRATAQTYLLDAADVGARLSVTVTATKDGYLPSLQTSTTIPRVTSQFDDRLTVGEAIASGARIVSANGRFELTQRTDGNLVIYDTRTRIPLWASATAGSDRRTKLSSNGSLVVLSSRGVTLWSSGTKGKKTATAVLRNDGRLVLYTKGKKALWSSYSSGR
jgi:surface antigen